MHVSLLEDEPYGAPLPPDSPLFSLPNLIITPHIAAFSADFEKNFWNSSVNRILKFAGGCGEAALGLAESGFQCRQKP